VQYRRNYTEREDWENWGGKGVTLSPRKSRPSIKPRGERPVTIFIIIIIIIITAIEFSLGGNSPYTSTDKTNKNKYT
jgi:hypothetical protein